MINEHFKSVITQISKINHLFCIIGPSPVVNTISDLCEMGTYRSTEDRLLRRLVHEHVAHIITLYIYNSVPVCM